ncbi:hypothetical protein TNCV_1847651 [Trichonephila clavipes]|nr:hypothetical protein TNCV_1847651 [Trichonephila clavipes]
MDSRPSGIVVSVTDCSAVGSGFETQRSWLRIRHCRVVGSSPDAKRLMMLVNSIDVQSPHVGVFGKVEREREIREEFRCAPLHLIAVQKDKVHRQYPACCLRVR